MQLSKRDLTAISDEEEAGVQQYNGNGRSGWRGRPSSSSVAPLPPGEAVERTQSLSILSPLPEVSMERGLSERQLSISSNSKRVHPVSTPSSHMHASPTPQLSRSANNSNLLASPPRIIQPECPTYPSALQDASSYPIMERASEQHASQGRAASYSTTIRQRIGRRGSRGGEGEEASDAGRARAGKDAGDVERCSR